MKSAEFIKKTGADSLPCCVLLHGEDIYFVDAALKKIISSSGITNDDMNLEKFSDERFGDFMQSLNTFPFLSDKRVSVLSIEMSETKEKNQDKNQDKPQDKQKVKPQDKMLSKMISTLKKYAASPNPQTVAVVCIKSGVTEIEGFESVDCGKESMQNVVRWIVLSMKRQGITITESLATVIAERCNLDMYSVKNSVDILCARKESGEITQKDVDDMVADEAEAQVFDLINAIVNKDVKKTFSLVDKIKSQKISGTAFASMLYNNYRRMFYACVSNTTDDELATLFRVKPYAIKKARETGKKYPIKKLKSAMEYLSAVDIKIKSGEMRDGGAIDSCVLHLADI